jgi:hypothetical protein
VPLVNSKNTAEIIPIEPETGNSGEGSAARGTFSVLATAGDI